MSNLGNKTVMARNIKHYMDINKKSRNDICEELGFSYTTFSDWYNGNKYPRIDKIEMLANYFKIDKADLVEERKEYNKKSRAVRIPVLGRVVAGVPIEAIEEIIDYEEIDEQMARTGEYFALQVTGDSMEPRMVEGDVVIVRKQETCVSGDVAIVLVNGDEATVKRVRMLENGIMMIPFNTKYVPWTYTAKECEEKPVHIIGKVVECRQKY